jgi:hypothetical protein
VENAHVLILQLLPPPPTTNIRFGFVFPVLSSVHLPPFTWLAVTSDTPPDYILNAIRRISLLELCTKPKAALATASIALGRVPGVDISTSHLLPMLILVFILKTTHACIGFAFTEMLPKRSGLI